MNLPDILKKAIDQEARSISKQDLLSATQELSQRYRDKQQRQGILQRKDRFIQSDNQRTAYVLSRMPATFGALSAVLTELKNRADYDFKSILDIGSGPGTAMWAAAELFSSTASFTMMEQDSALITLGKKLASHSTSPLISQSKWLQKDVLSQDSFPESDLIIVSYALGEWSNQARKVLIDKLWKSTLHTLVMIEPGTMEGFGIIKEARQQLIDSNAHIIAPCPHSKACPMPPHDWCHFSTRIERSSLHRQAKEAALGHEDEKFSYTIASKQHADTSLARIIRHPQKRSGHVIFDLCTRDQGLAKETISRSEGELYKEARDLEWGDAFFRQPE